MQKLQVILYRLNRELKLTQTPVMMVAHIALCYHQKAFSYSTTASGWPRASSIGVRLRCNAKQGIRTRKCSINPTKVSKQTYKTNVNFHVVLFVLEKVCLIIFINSSKTMN